MLGKQVESQKNPARYLLYWILLLAKAAATLTNGMEFDMVVEQINSNFLKLITWSNGNYKSSQPFFVSVFPPATGASTGWLVF